MPRDDTFDARVLEDAFAFIDAFYATSSESAASDTDDEWQAAPAPSARDERCDALLGLRGALRDLCGKLLTTSCVADCCRDELRGQLGYLSVVDADLDAIQNGLQVCRSVWERQHQRERRVHLRLLPLTDATIACVLRRRLDELVARASSSGSERPLLQRECPTLDEVAGCDVSPFNRGALVRFRSGRFIPFKLSILTRAAWGVVAESSFHSPGQSQNLGFDRTQEIVARVVGDEDGSETLTALRRVDLPDGSVLISWAGIHSGSYAELEPSYSNADAHEMGWLRVGRLTSDAALRHRAYVETVCDVVIQPRQDDDRELDGDQLERLQQLMQAQQERDGTRNRQILENRMMEATLPSPASHRAISK